ncbi:occlusion-derived virus envelope protein 56 [Neodiprion sertifer nucleopolyhedrovirus]|uniref:Occlusion-derived virus envelope protein 56 n=1 Tax=Neodiprion sertifer nucleopolyhedrovirus TaxID=111874 RepID=Q6JKC2_9CBAC|nr:occlusion-derived virus envelope protein 56 [Neodiprion sertifer nucleopolyhedrovirus]AAQ96415.1 occlusion-derived virus envelope protein 56 [Neodiprion sertifer nucleopolyhedrovirus]
MFSGLRKTAKIYDNTADLLVDNTSLVVGKFSNFDAVFSLPSAKSISKGYVIDYATFIGNVDTFSINKILRQADDVNIETLFNATDTDIAGLNVLRKAANVPDNTIYVAEVKRINLKSLYPSLDVKTYDGIASGLNNNPKLYSYLKGLGVATLAGGAVVLVLLGIDLVQDIIDALNRTGGSYFTYGEADNVESCYLRYRSCGVDQSSVDTTTYCQNFLDPILEDDVTALTAICDGYDIDTEISVCRQSDPYADPDSEQWVDVSELAENQTLSCVEPYTFSDLISDLGLDWLLGDDSILGNSFTSGSDSISSLSSYIGYIAIFAIIIIVGIVFIKLSKAVS